MSITEISFYGNARYQTTSLAMNPYHDFARTQTFDITVARNLDLPDATTLDLGGPIVEVQNLSTSTQSVTVRDDSLATIVTVAPGNVASLWLQKNDTENGTWKTISRTLNGSTVVSRRSRSTVTSPSTPTTYIPDCPGYKPPDPCTNADPSAADFNTQMFFNSCDALNSQREPIRAADLLLPDKLFLRFDTFALPQDNNHPWGGTLDIEIFHKLRNSDQWHQLDFKNTLTNQKSRHWHHIRRKGGGPSWQMTTGGVTDVTKHIWQRLIPYTVGLNNYTLELRIVAEFTLTDPRTEGAFGALINIYAFSDEVEPSFVEGNNYTPAGSAVSMPFDRDDPVIWGGDIGSEGDEEKFCHPQMALCANIPTTFQDPCGGQFVPANQQRFASCYEEVNGAPWSAGGSVVDSIERNIVFGVIGDGMACMTLGGGDGPVPVATGGGSTSELFEFVTIENKAGVGRTFLKPGNSGWDEPNGTLDVAGGSDIEIGWCGENDQNTEAIDDCIGHVLEPFKAIGGTHRCWRDILSPQPNPEDACCLDMAQVAVLNITEQCTEEWTKYVGCIGVDGDCRNHNSYRSSFIMPLMDYDYKMNTGIRSITWTLYVDDPLYVRENYTYDNSDVGNLTNISGTSTFNSNHIEATTVETGNVEDWMLSHDPITYGDVIVGGIAEFSHADDSYVFGCFVRGVQSVGDINDGYLAEYHQFTGDIYIYLLSGGIKSTLISDITTLPKMTENMKISFVVDGDDFTFTAEEDEGGTDIATITIKSCTYQSDGEVGLYADGIPAITRVFNSFDLADNNYRKKTAEVDVIGTTKSYTVAPEICEGYLECEHTVNPDCGTTPYCDCYTGSFAKGLFDYAANSTQAVFAPCGEIPSTFVCDEDPLNCPPPLSRCKVCPPPSILGNVNYPPCINTCCNDPAECTCWNAWGWTPQSCS